jgi:LPS-assembly protein
MFHENRFVGGDRVGDANQITLSVTSRMINARGIEGARLHIGQIFYFNDRKVVLPGQAAQTGDLSAFVAGFSTNLFQHLYLRGDLEWDADNEVTRKLALQAGYRLSADKVFNLGYRMRRAVPGIIRNELLDIEQTSVAAHWPLAGNWSVVGSWKYALTERRSLDMFAGVEYNSCCWGFRAVGRRFLSNLEGDYQNGIFLQFELKGLAGTGRKTLDFLSENIPGYQSDF